MKPIANRQPMVKPMEFVQIETLFAHKGERTVERLIKVYEDHPRLKRAIRSICRAIFDDHALLAGKKILLKPNWVLHDRNKDDEFCLRTNDNVLLATLELLLETGPASITVCDAPIQGCNWEGMLKPGFRDAIASLRAAHCTPIVLKDLRRSTFDRSQNVVVQGRQSLQGYMIFDLGTKSFLEPITTKKPRFRVTDYDPDRLAESHAPGRHRYCISKELFDADVVISLPKIKTHQKTGITGALKNIVGLNGDKDYLPHHRVGGEGFGGDCYPGKNVFRRASEYVLDNANRHRGEPLYWPMYWTSVALWKSSLPKDIHQLAAGWYGNDTCWRMVMDLNTIAVFGKRDGTISKEPQRVLYSLCDGIIGGEGNGPIDPRPSPLGILCFSNNSALTDLCMARLMGFDARKIPLLREASLMAADQEVRITLDDQPINVSDLSDYAILTTPPPGWLDVLGQR